MGEAWDGWICRFWGVGSGFSGCVCVSEREREKGRRIEG